jgi:hypothetical protein
MESMKNRWKRDFIDSQGISIKAMSFSYPSTTLISQNDYLTDINDWARLDLVNPPVI